MQKDDVKEEIGLSDKPVTVTVILTNYNHSRYLDCSLGGIVNQTRPADEIIVIDDGSTDDSLALIKDYTQKHSQIRVIENVQNRGVQHTIARALGAVTCDWIVWAAADDKLLPNFLQRSVEMIERNRDIGIVFSQLATFREDTQEDVHYGGDNNPASAFYVGEEATAFPPEALMERLKMGYLWLSGNTAVCRRDCLLDVGAFVPALEWHSDWFGFYAVALRYGACGIPETLAMMRVVPETYSSAGMSNKKRQSEVMNAIIDVLNRPDFADLRAKFRARPCLFSPFAKSLLSALIWRPRDWDLLIRLANWAANHLSVQYTGRLQHVRLPRGIRTRVLNFGATMLVRLTDWISPVRWKTEIRNH